MAMAADRQYLAVSRHIAMLKQDEALTSKTQAKNAGVAGKPHPRVFATTCIIAATITGLLVGALAGLVGLPLAAEWGVIAFTLNYIPFIGPLIATIFPTLFALVQFESWQLAIVVFVCLNLIQFVIGSYLEPRIAGAALSISPFIVLFAVFFWSFLWGVAGAFIGVPIVIALLAVCGEHESTRWIALLLSGREGGRM